MPRKAGFRLGIYLCKELEIVDFAAPYGVFSVARRFDPELEAFFVAESLRPVSAQAGFTVLPNYAFSDLPAMDAFLIPGGFGTRAEINNTRLHEYIRSLPEATLLALADHGELSSFMPSDGGDCETVLARFKEAGIRLDALAAHLQIEGAKAFVKSWNELLAVLSSKSNALKKGELHALSAK